jgi:hypothetical protein
MSFSVSISAASNENFDFKMAKIAVRHFVFAFYLTSSA